MERNPANRKNKKRGKTMHKTIIILLSAILFFSCGSNRKTDPGKPTVTVSILPQKTFVEAIAGDDFNVQVLVPPGASPESYTILPSQLKDISRSRIWFRMGYIGFEQSWKDKIAEINPELQVVDLSEGLDLIVGEEVQHGDHVHLHGVDPHYWLSPGMVKQMTQKITEELIRLHPEKSQDYQSGYEAFAREADDLDRRIRSALHEFRGRSFITFHPSLTYFARDYGLVQVPLESGGKEPTPQHMAEVIEIARKENISAIYIQSEFDKEHARVFAEEINGEIIEVKPLSPDWQQNLMDMTALFIANF
jgi:zinc transport system substrate-binding protein